GRDTSRSQGREEPRTRQQPPAPDGKRQPPRGARNRAQLSNDRWGPAPNRERNPTHQADGSHTVRNANTTLCPPNPNESFSAAIRPSTGSFRASPRTTSALAAASGSRFSTLIVGGATRWYSASTVATDSTPPAPPSRCPVIDFVADTAMWSASSPNTFRSALSSAMSPAGVDVACALTCTISAGSRS